MTPFDALKTVYTPEEVSRAQSAALDTLRALQVLTLTPHIRAYLVAKDPKALDQAERAIVLALPAGGAR